jgi:hypothetical protein
VELKTDSGRHGFRTGYPSLEQAGLTDTERLGGYGFAQLPGRMIFMDLSDGAWAIYESSTGGWLIKGNGVDALVKAVTATRR